MFTVEAILNRDVFRNDYSQSYAIKKHLIDRMNINKNPDNSHGVLMAGTSRMMANFSADRVGEHFGLKAFNLGNLGNSYAELYAYLKSIKPPEYLLLEVSTHQFLQKNSEKKDTLLQRYFKLYTAEKTLWNGWVGANLQKIFFPFGYPKISKTTIKNVKDWMIKGPYDLDHLMMAYQSSDYGQYLHGDGQVSYRHTIVDKKQSSYIRHFVDETEQLISQYSSSEMNENDKQAFQDIIAYTKNNDVRLFLVRPPLGNMLYSNDQKRDDVQKYIQSQARKHQLKYIDMNQGGHDYSMADQSHIDWFDTERATEDLIKNFD